MSKRTEGCEVFVRATEDGPNALMGVIITKATAAEDAVAIADMLAKWPVGALTVLSNGVQKAQAAK